MQTIVSNSSERLAERLEVESRTNLEVNAVSVGGGGSAGSAISTGNGVGTHNVSGHMNLTMSSKEQYEKVAKPPQFLNNYISGVRNDLMDMPAERRKLDNERSLLSYYGSKVHTSRHDSVTSGASDTQLSADSPKRNARLRPAQPNLSRLLSDHQTPLRKPRKDKKYSPEVVNKGYLSYCSKLPIPDQESPELTKRHNMWFPIMKWDIASPEGYDDGPALTSRSSSSSLGPKQSAKAVPMGRENSWIFTNATIHASADPTEHNTFLGSFTMPPLFGEMKLPPFVYHCAVELGNHIYIMGGLTPSYYYSDEIPDLSMFRVDGVKNLPPPLIESVVNSPAMVNNHELFVVSSASYRVRKPHMTGQIPPPLLCMTASILTKRHLFCYGGFEIKTETSIDDKTGKFYLKKRAYLNNTGYVLDVITFKFSKVELIAQPTSFTAYPSTVPRFGHSQVSVAHSSMTPVKCPSCTNVEPHDHHEDLNDSILSKGVSSNSPYSLPIRTESNPSKAGTPERILNNKLSGSLNSGVYTILVMGGYRQSGDDDYTVLRDLWKIEVTVTARGKRNYFKFADTALATMFPCVPLDLDCPTWPAKRAFHACQVFDTASLDEPTLEEELQIMLASLKRNFSVDGGSAAKSSNQAQRRRSATFKSDTDIDQQSSDCELDPLTARESSHSRPVGKTLVIHGGSNKDQVYGDMWFFDLDTEEWSRSPTYMVGNNGKRIQGDLTMVGHTLVRAGPAAILTGGFTQEDVKKHWPTQQFVEEESPHEQVKPATFHLLNIGNMTFSNLFVGEEHRVQSGEVPKPWADTYRLNSIVTIYSNGFLYIVGGLVAKTKDIKQVYLRGTITICILPMVSTPKLLNS
ncbi:LAMI_0F13586g1_1 [Lachancea mirantina]|uniref:LAMI_0F13586g1_1 n=1 Tax=Lachancea mirantina TaxID=1230905 RepID=A0A1G4K3G7_9SACH|nr:LAMI_0F13586g1_1 [Lachancea mirantina]